MKVAIPVLDLSIIKGFVWSPAIDAMQSAIIELVFARARLSPPARALMDRQLLRTLFPEVDRTPLQRWLDGDGEAVEANLEANHNPTDS